MIEFILILFIVTLLIRKLERSEKIKSKWMVSLTKELGNIKNILWNIETIGEIVDDENMDQDIDEEPFISIGDNSHLRITLNEKINGMRKNWRNN